jgi:hypothetical protein
MSGTNRHERLAVAPWQWNRQLEVRIYWLSKEDKNKPEKSVYYKNAENQKLIPWAHGKKVSKAPADIFDVT